MNFSLDFWNTIAQPNREFSYQRNLLIAKSLGISIKSVKEIYTNVKLNLDTVAEKYGIGNDTKSAYRSLGIEFSNKLLSRSNFEMCNIIMGLEKDIQKLFVKYPPHISPETKSVIRQLRNPHKFCITSNTNFISGSCIAKVLKTYDLEPYFSFYIFSDHIGVSKPNPRIFEIVKDNFANTDKIIHIGDHSVCDNSGAIFEHRIIKDTSELPELLKELSK